MSRLTMNPITALDLRQRARARSTGVILGLWLLLGFGAVMLFSFIASQIANDPFSGVTAAEVGTGGFESIVGLLIGVLLFVLPGLAAGAIAGERERQTLLPLQSSLLTPGQIVFGKFWGNMAVAIVLVTCAMPFLAIAIVLTGRGVGAISRATLFLLVLSAIISGISVGASGIVRSVRNAVLVAYLIVFLSLVGPLIAIAVMGAIDSASDGPSRPPYHLPFYASPIVLVADGVSAGAENVNGPLSGIASSVRSEMTDDGVDFGEMADVGGVPLWLRCLIVQGGFAALLMWRARSRLRVPAEFER